MNYKIILNFLVLLIIKITNCYAQDPNIIKDIKSEELKGNVKNITISNFIIGEKFGEPADLLLNTTVITFNEQGNYLSKIYKCGGDSYKGCFNKQENYTYDKEGNCLILYYSYENGSYPINVNYECSDGLIQKVIHPSTSTSIGSNAVYYYDSKRNLVKIEYYDSSNTVEEVRQYKYDSNNKIIEDERFNSEGNLKKKQNYNYDAKGRLISHKVYLKDYTLDLTNTTKYTYDENNNVLMESGTYKDAYEPNGFKSFNHGFNYIYDIKKNVLEKNAYNRYSDSLIKFSDYDINGNWYKKVEFSSKGRPEKKTVRKIEYF